jgi:DNA-binding NarL/FixJ family response regulator
MRFQLKESIMGRRYRPKILIAEDHTLVAEACMKLLEEEYEVVGHVRDGLALIAAIPNLMPEVLLVDISMPLLNGLDAVEEIRKLKLNIKVVFMTMNDDIALAAEAFRRGASGYLLKTSAASDLLIALKTVLAGKQYVSSHFGQDSLELKLANEGTPALPGILTPRQKQVLQLLVEGRTMKEAGRILNLKPRTIAFHKYRIMEILHIKNYAGLVQYAVRERIITP